MKRHKLLVLIYDFYMYNLLQALFSTMRFEPQQPKRHEVGTRSVVKVVKHETESASPQTSCDISNENNKSSRGKHDIAGDLRRLEDAFFDGHPMQSGFIIETNLQDLLLVCPRQRRRKDAFRSLTNALSKIGVSLIIKTKRGSKN